jgi:flagellar hook protein FlgE
MSFQTGLSGLNASSRSLDVIGNNIANANTTGMKYSRAEFSDMVSMSLGAAGSASSGAGIGVEVADLAQQFTQGNISTTGNSLDVAINGAGFLQLTQPDGSLAYTRDGALKLDKDGYLKTNSGAFVMGYPTDTSGVPQSASIGKLQMPTSAPIGAQVTKTVAAQVNLDARATGTEPLSTYGTTLDIYDGQGVASTLPLYFQKDSTTSNTWNVFVDSAGTNQIGQLTFDASGKLTGPAIAGSTVAANNGKYGFTLSSPTKIPSNNPNDTDKFVDGPIDIIFGGPLTTTSTSNSNSTQYGTAFAVSNLTQDGYTAGDLTGLTIGSDGVVTARYSNGQTQANGQLALADFRNVQGLVPLGGNSWAASYASGLPVQGSPAQGKFGALRAGALEDSNVDLTTELVNLMTAQRSYQSNAQTIKTQDQVMSTLLNMR